MTTYSQNGMTKLTVEEKNKILSAAHLARTLFPGEIGEALAEQLFAVHEFGYRVGMSARSHRLIAALHDEQRKRDQQARAEWRLG